MGFVIDRFEGEFALCESECGEEIKLPRTALPESAKEGDVFADADGDFVLDPAAAQARKKAAEDRLSRLFRK